MRTTHTLGMLAGPLTLLTSAALGVLLLVGLAVRPSTPLQLASIMGVVSLLLFLGTALGANRVAQDVMETSLHANRIHEALVARQTSNGRLPDRLEELGLSATSVGLSPQPFRYAPVGSVWEGSYRLAYASPRGTLHWNGFAFLRRPDVASASRRGPPLPPPAPPAP